MSKGFVNSIPLSLNNILYVFMDNLIRHESLITKTLYDNRKVSYDSWLNYAYALLIVAGSDGEVSKPEMDWLIKEFSESIGSPEDFTEKIKAFDFEKGDLSEILTKIELDNDLNLKKLFLYDAIKMSFADDDYSEKEKEAVEKAAELLGVPAFFTRAIEGAINTERSISVIRKSIFEVNSDDEEDLGIFIEGDQAIWQEVNDSIRQVFGIQQMSEEAKYNFGSALMMIAGADGEVSKPEKDWYLRNIAVPTNTSEKTIDKILALNLSLNDLEGLINKLKSDKNINFGRVLIYTAIKMSKADGRFTTEEKEAVEKAGKLLKVPKNVIESIHYLANTEENLIKLRTLLFRDEG